MYLTIQYNQADETLTLTLHTLDP